MNKNIGCVLLATSDDFDFLKSSLRNIHDIFFKINVMIGDKFWNGDPEDEDKINELIDKTELYDNVSIMKYNVGKKLYNPWTSKVLPDIQVNDSMYWEGYARVIGTINMPLNTEYIIYLDSDEIIDNNQFKTWLNYDLYKNYDIIKFANFWYWREPIYRARNYIEDSVTMVKYKFAYNNKDYIFSNLGRHGLYELTENKIRSVMGIDNKPMIHHYSWVRNKEQMIRKVKNWGHRNDKNNWIELVEEEFSRPFNGTDFLKNLQYDVVDDKYINI